jgi:conjugative transposon TraM protein
MSEENKTKKNLLLVLVVLIGLVVIYFIFSSDSGEEQSRGMNKELPAPEDEELPEKDKAYVDDALNNLALSGNVGDADEFRLDSVATQMDALDAAVERSKANQEALQKNVVNVSNMVAKAKANDEQEEAQERVRAEKKELERQLREKDAELNAAKFANQLNAILNKDTVLQAVNSQIGMTDEFPNANVVSAIPDNQGDVATTLGSQVRRSGGFYGMSNVPVHRNSIKACAYGEQLVGDGQSLRIRLLEPMMVSGQIIPVGSVLVGACRISVDRLLVSINSVEYGGVITRVALEVYDNDGQQGLYVPGSLELEAGREIGADIVSSVGSTATSQTSMFSQQSASEQIKADVGRGVVQGTFKFLGKKLQEIKVTVQDRHKVFLISQK